MHALGVDAVKDRLIAEVRAALSSAAADVREVKMFGGVGFMFRGNLMAAASARGLLVRVGPPGEVEALARRGATLMVMRGRPMPGYVRVEPTALEARAVKSWMKLALAFAETLPPKASRKKTVPAQRPKSRTPPTRAPRSR
jgi:TfoX/Sxy family transcriptional regulator of competence genes